MSANLEEEIQKVLKRNKGVALSTEQIFYRLPKAVQEDINASCTERITYELASKIDDALQDNFNVCNILVDSRIIHNDSLIDSGVSAIKVYWTN